MAPLIAIVGCDGSGKSTLAADVAAAIARERRVEICYLGLGSGTIGLRIARMPLIGRVAERFLSRKATRTRTTGERIPGLATALVVYRFSQGRRRRFEAMMALRRAGVVVVTDRYPQVEVPGFYDGPGLSAAAAGSHAVAWLAARERRMYVDMARHHPDLIVRLDVDVATAHARKPDHDPDLLARKVAATPHLRFDGAPIVDIDARAPYADVRHRALQAILPVLGIDPQADRRQRWHGYAMTEAKLAPLIALVGSDGSGKSTVADALLAWMQAQRPTVLHHLGKQTGHIGRTIARVPGFGRHLDSNIARRADIAQDKGRPGIVPVLVIYAFSMRRVRRFRRMLADRARGVAVLADRFPQLSVPGPMDGLGLASVAGAGGMLGRLARRERAHYAWMAEHRPDLVIRLNVDLATALARKPDHRPSTLARKIHDVPLLDFAGAPILDLDATRPLDEVIAEAKRAILPLLCLPLL